MKLKRVAMVAALFFVCVGLMGFSCDKPKAAAVAVNKYAEALSHFQDAEIKWHDIGEKAVAACKLRGGAAGECAKLVKVDAATHHKILVAEKAAAQAGRNLNAAITLANNGGDPTLYVDAAQNTFDDLLAVVKADDPQAQQELTSLAGAAGALLKNAVSVIQAIKKADLNPGGTFPGLAFLFLGLTLAGATVSLGKVLELLNALVELEPIAFDLVLKLSRSLKGKTTEEVVAMNEAIFGKVEAVADAELAKEQLPPGT